MPNSTNTDVGSGKGLNDPGASPEVQGTNSLGRGSAEPSAAARAFYLAMHGDDGGRWELVDPRYHYVWADKAERFFTLLAEVQ